MQRLRVELSNRRGFTLILSVLLITVFIGAAAFAVDVGHMNVRRADLHAASDAAALAGIEEFAATSRGDSALKEAQAFASRFKADTSHLTVASADFTLGFWSGTAFTPGGTDTNAARAIVRYTGSLMFGPVLGIRTHAGSATSIAVGINKAVTASSCLSPVVISYQQLLDQLPGGKHMNDTLTAADIDSLATANAGKAVTFDIPNGTKVNSLAELEFYQINVPPLVPAGATQAQADGPPSASDFKNGFTCTGGAYNVGIGDLVEPINGQKANQAKQGLDNILNKTFPVTIEVALADSWVTTNPLCPGGCFEVKYLGSFTVTSVGGKSLVGYFNVLDPQSAGVVSTGPPGSVGPLNSVKTHLVF